MPIWTPGALSSEARSLETTAWRLVEAQNRVSTLKLVDSLAEQAILEDLLEEAKPPVPPECRRLHYLLATPFRYGAPYPTGSRFRRAGYTPGVFYASEAPHVAVAEIAFHRLLFFAESPGTPWPANPAEFTAFSVPFRAAQALDLIEPPLAADSEKWMNPIDYAACQALADLCRQADILAIRYKSVRDPGGGVNFALLSCALFAATLPQAAQSWRIHLSANGVQALCEFPDAALEFRREAFAADPRVASASQENRYSTDPKESTANA